MKTRQIIYLILLLIFSSCTYRDDAKTIVHCPCRVTSIAETRQKDYYYVTVTSTNENRHFTFYTTYLYQIGDIIK